MPNSIITTAGLALLARAQLEGFTVPIDRMIFADISGLNTDLAPDPGQTAPAAAQIVLDTEIGQVGKLDDNTVVYSRILTAAEGNYFFNWIGIYSTVHSTLIAVCNVPRQQKFKTDGFRAGNTMYKNFAIQYANAAILTAINITPETWQYNLDDLYAKIDHNHDNRYARKDHNHGDIYVLKDDIDLDFVAYTNREAHFTELLTAPDTAKGNSSGQVINTRSLQKELEDFDVPSKIDFNASRWQLVADASDDDHGRYRMNLITSAGDYTHVYKVETYGRQVFDDNLEVRFNSEGYIQMVSESNFDGFINTRVKRQLPVYSYSAVRDGDNNITGLILTGLASNPANVTELHLPSSADYTEGGITRTYPVIEIGMDAFTGNYNITAVYIGNGTKYIRQNAFRGCSSLASVSLPETIVEIGANAFYNCTALADLELNEGLIKIESLVLAQTSIEVVTIPSTLQVIDGSPFTSMPALKEIKVAPGNPYFVSSGGILFSSDMSKLVRYPTLKAGTAYTVPAAVRTIGFRSFDRIGELQTVSLNNGLLAIETEAFVASRMSSILIPATVTSIDRNAFGSMTALTAIEVDAANPNYRSADGILFTKTGEIKLLQYPAGKPAGVYDIPAGTQILGYECFHSAKVTGVTFPQSLYKFETAPFYICSGLTSVTLSQWITDAGSGPFLDCRNLTEINVNAANPNYKSVNGVLYSKDGTVLVQYPVGNAATVYNVPTGTVEIAYGAFYHGTKLTAVNLPDSLINVRTYAFMSCSQISNLVFGPNVASLQVTACGSMTALTTITFRNPDTEMTGAFQNNPNMMFVYGYPGSTAEAFAAAYPLIFRSL